MKIDVITLFPEIIQSYCESGVIGRALKLQLFSLETCNPRDFTFDVHHTVDDRPYGGGPGMVMKYAPLKESFDYITHKNNQRGFRIYVSPRGKVFNQSIARSLLQYPIITFLSGRYEGIDERIIETEIDLELSIGDYVLSGGELAVNVIIDSMIRLIPGVLSNYESVEQDSFSESNMLDYPHYTRPEEVNGLRVPEILLSGNHKLIQKWRYEKSLSDTKLRRPDLIKGIK